MVRRSIVVWLLRLLRLSLLLRRTRIILNPLIRKSRQRLIDRHLRSLLNPRLCLLCLLKLVAFLHHSVQLLLLPLRSRLLALQ